MRVLKRSIAIQAISRRQALIEAGIAALIAALMSLAVFGPILRWIATGWSGGDMLATYVNADIWRGFRYGVTDQFGFPLGMNQNYFPAVDITENTFAQLITQLTGRPFVGVNLLILLTFPLVAFLAYFLFRITGLTGPLAITGAVVFSLIPYHFGRALGHTYLSTLYSAITGMMFVLLVGSGRFEQIIRRLRKPSTSRRTRVWVLLGFAGLALITAWTGVYYAAFTLILGAAALLWRYAHRASWRSLAIDAMPFVTIGVLAVLGIIPSVLTTRGDPPLAVLSERMPYESVIFAGYLAVALLPLPQSNLPGFDVYNRSVTEAIAAAGRLESSAATNYGTWITAAALVVVVVALVLRARYPRPAQENSTRTASLSFLVYLIVITLLWFIPWGLNYLFAGTITAQIRAWNRLTPYLLLLFLLAAAAALHRTKAATTARWALPISALVLTLTFVDAVLPFRSAYADNGKRGAELTKAGKQYAQDLNALIPQQCGVLQLPYMAYPEFGGVGDMNDYDHFWPSITNPGKRWSYGAVKSTDAGVWSSQLPEVPTESQVALLRGAGFCAIHVDRRAWPEDNAAAVLDDLESRYGSAVVTGNDGDWLAFDIRSAPSAESEAATDFLHQPMITADPVTTHPRETDLGDAWWWTREADAFFTITPSRTETPVSTVSGTLTAPECGPRTVQVTLSDGTEIVEETLRVRTETPTAFELTLPAPATSPASLTVSATGSLCEVDELPRTRYVKVGNLTTY